MACLVIAESNPSAPIATLRRTIRAATLLADVVDVLLIGAGSAALADVVAATAQVREVLVAEATAAGAEEVCAAVLPLAENYRYFISSASSFGKNAMPRLAACLDVAQVSDVTRIISAETFEHPIYAGNAIETVEALDDKIVLTIRTSSFEPVGESEIAAPIRSVLLSVPAKRVEVVGQSEMKSDRPELTAASVVISGGRGLGSRQLFLELLQPLADRLGAALGASRAAVDAGYAPNDWQVGQTGKIVAPDIYIAVGISGAIQHVAGMKDAKIVVAINKDASAPIFEIADYGLVGDLFELVPDLTAKLG